MNNVNTVNEEFSSMEWQKRKSKKQLNISRIVSSYQKEWFLNLRERIKQGESFAICNADEAEEIFLTMDIPVIVKQWWSSLISAKQLSSHYFNLLNQKGYDLCSYCVLGLACTMDQNPGLAPWGGLPKPAVIIGSTDCDAGLRITEIWAREYNTSLNDHWDEVIESHRLDFRVEELKSLIRFLEVATGKTFRMAKFLEVMELINEQESYFRKARNLIAETAPSPVGLTDQLSNYPPQWQRGTTQGRDLTKMFYEEIKERVKKGEAACPNEKLRLMWIGAGLWTNTSFYQYFEEKYGAVFMCSWV
jgi:benzoyl-CoA reductase/2-hydroxyglutaryl-CoA dehydratase subunit BcrC/BadD/HgdB